MPERCCLNSAGPGEVSRTTSAMNSIGNAVSNSKARLPKKSSNCLATICHEDSGVVRNTSSGRLNISSKLARAICVAKKSATSQASTPSSSQSWMTFSTRSKWACLALTSTPLTECSCSNSTSSNGGAARLNSAITSMLSSPCDCNSCRSRAISARLPARMMRRL